jgi:hypothetical protein
MIRIGRVVVLMALAIAWGAPETWSQDRSADALKRAIESRFDVLPLRDGVALHPRTPIAGVRSIEVTEGAVAIDGQPATGAELRSRLGAQADAVLELSYLTAERQRSLFGDRSSAPAAPLSPTSERSTPSAPPAPEAAPVPPAPPAPEVAPVPPAAAAPPVRESRGRRRGSDRSGDRVRIGGNVDVGDGETVDGDVVAVGGSVRVDGDVRGDVVSVGGGVTLGRNASVDGDVTVIGGRLQRDPGARVGGKAQEVGLGGINFGNWTWRRNPLGFWMTSMIGSAVAFVGTLARVGILCLIAALVVLFGRDYMYRAGTVAARESLKAGAVGLLAQILFVPILVITCIVLVLTIVGIPLLLLLPFVILGIAVVAVIGFSGVANRVGVLASHRFGWRDDNPYAVTIVGVILLMAPVLLARLSGMGGGVLFPITMALGIVGFLIEYAAWTVGLGAMALARFERRHPGDVSAPGSGGQTPAPAGT